MDRNKNEEDVLRSVALQNARTILLARQRAEEALVQAKEALEQRTQELAGSLAMMQATLESTTDGILVTDGFARIRNFNEKYLKMWDLSDSSMEARDHRALLEITAGRTPDAGKFLARVEEIYRSAPAETYDLIELVDGQVFERFSSPQLVEQRDVGRVWSFRDITERRRAEQALHKQSEWLRVTLASIGDAVVTTDTQGRVLSLNGVAEALTGWTQAEAEGRALSEVFRIVNEDTRYPAENPAERALREGRVVGLTNHTILIARDGSEISIDDSAAPIRDAADRVHGVVLVFRDIRARMAAEVDQKSLLAALKDSDRRKDEFLAILAHELRNPLAPIRNAVQIFRAHQKAVPDLHWATDVIDRQVQQMTRLVDDLLDISRITSGKLELRRERVQLATVISSAVEASQPLIEKWGHELTISIPTVPLELEVDVTRLAQVIMNLLTNAAKYTDQGGHIWLTAERDGSQVSIRVKDTGIGIPAEMLPHVFEMFTQVNRSMDRSEGGLGIGLTLVQRLVAMHGGVIEALSAGAGQGSEFIVRLPIREENSVDRALQKPPVATSARRILVVDDNRDAADSLSMLLRTMGHEVATAYDGLEAVGVVAVFHPEVVLLDIGLPKLNGYEVAREIRSRDDGAGITLVALTGWGQEDDQRRSREAGFDRHMTKPIDFAGLQQVLAKKTRG